MLLLCLSFRRQFFCFVLFFILSFLKERSVLFFTLKGCVGFYIIFFSKEWSSCRRGFVVLLDNPSSCRIRFQRKIIILNLRLNFSRRMLLICSLTRVIGRLCFIVRALDHDRNAVLVPVCVHVRVRDLTALDLR